MRPRRVAGSDGGRRCPRRGIAPELGHALNLVGHHCGWQQLVFTNQRCRRSRRQTVRATMNCTHQAVLHGMRQLRGSLLAQVRISPWRTCRTDVARIRSAAGPGQCVRNGWGKRVKQNGQKGDPDMPLLLFNKFTHPAIVASISALRLRLGQFVTTKGLEMSLQEHFMLELLQECTSARP